MVNPLRDPPPAEVRLARPPLKRVVVAISFPAILKIAEERGIIDFQDKVRKAYPNLQREQEIGIQLQIGPSGDMLQPQQVSRSLWRFLSLDGAWRLSLSTEHLALEADEGYVSRDDFLERLNSILDTFVHAFEPSICTRVGMRYINVLDVSDLNEVKGWVRQGLRSLSDTEVWEHIKSSNHTVEFNVDEGFLITRWGVIPPGNTHDPNVLAPTDYQRWFMDLDCFSEDGEFFTSENILSSCRQKTERIYSFFRWAMEPDFIESRKDG